MLTKSKQIEEMANEILLIPDAPEHEARLSAEALYSAGYRKVEKMPVLTDEMLFRVAFDREPNPGEIDPEEKFDFYDAYRVAAQAQRDADYRFLMEEA